MMIIVPSSAVETMGLGALGGLTAFGQAADEPRKPVLPDVTDKGPDEEPSKGGKS